MLTRSQTKVIIDFDAASIAWIANKKYIGNGSYKYICNTKNKNGTYCKRERSNGTNFCTRHSTHFANTHSRICE